MSKSLLSDTLHSCFHIPPPLFCPSLSPSCLYFSLPSFSPSLCSSHYLSDSDWSSFPHQSTAERDRARQLHLTVFIQLIFHTITSNIVTLHSWGNRAQRWQIKPWQSGVFNHTNRIIITERGQKCPSFNNDAHQQEKKEGEKIRTNLSMAVIMDEWKYTTIFNLWFSLDGFLLINLLKGRSPWGTCNG